MKEKILLIAGGSDPAGSEIDGTPDSKHNRENSFGNQLALRLDYKPVNIALAGAANQGISRSAIEWVVENYDKDKHDLFVLIGWADSSRMEIPYHKPTWYHEHNPFVDWYGKTNNNFIRINLGYMGHGREEKDFIAEYHRFMVSNELFLEVLSAHYILNLQYFLKMHKIPYLMCNTLFMFTTGNEHVKWYTDQIDKVRYIDWDDNENAFYYKYASAGYKNLKAKYFHHTEEPHIRYSDYLKEYIMENQLLDFEEENEYRLK